MASDMDVIRADADWPCTCPSEFHEPEKYVNCVLVRVARLTAEVDAAKNLLAVLHRDGGHHTEAVGFVQSCADGEQVRHELLKRAEQAEAALKETQWLLDIEKENHEADIATWTREIEEHRAALADAEARAKHYARLGDQARAALAAANEDAKDWRRRWTAANERAEKLKEALDVAEKLLIENCIVDGPAAPPEAPCSACGDGDTEQRYHKHEACRFGKPHTHPYGCGCSGYYPSELPAPEAKPLPLGPQTPGEDWNNSFGPQAERVESTPPDHAFVESAFRGVCQKLGCYEPESAHRKEEK